MGKVTIEDVARHAGVSPATVSRTLNRPELVVPEVQDRIRRSMTELRYQPNRHARALGGLQTRTVGLLFFQDLWDLVVNPFWAAATSTVYDHLLERDFDCNLIALGPAIMAQPRFSTTEGYDQFFRTRNVDGFLLVGAVPPREQEYFAHSDIPAVMWGSPSEGSTDLLHCDSDNAAGAAAAVDHLVARGRRRIGMILGDMSLVAAQHRRDGFVGALESHGLPVDPRQIVEGDFSRASGAAAMGQLLDRDTGIDAVFAANDEMAVGAIMAIRERGLRVPDDIAVVGFDNATLPEGQPLVLTSVSPAYDLIGAELVAALEDRITGRPHESTLIPTHLVVGETS